MSNIVDDTFRKAVLAANNARKADAEKRLAYYYDEQLSYLHDLLAAKFADLEALRELAAKVEDMGKYDVIFIGSPNWWSTIAPPVASFLASYDLSGKTVIPFVTHGGGGMARCADEVRKLCPKSTVLKGGAFAGEGIRTTRAALVKWVNETISINK